MNSVRIVECPRDAMQGIHTFIPTETKVKYLNTLLTAGFDTLDFGSFVSPKAIPQMVDTAQVLEQLNWHESNTRLLAIVANERGALTAAEQEAVRFLGFPFSVSETFQLRNTNSTIADSFDTVQKIQDACLKRDKGLVIYISMGFGNPYGDAYNPDIVAEWCDKLIALGVKTIALSDTIGVATPEIIKPLFERLIPAFPEVEFGAHLHTTPDTWKEKIAATWDAGCRRFDGALQGYGGCPMAADTLTGNMPTEKMLRYFEEQGINTGVNRDALQQSLLAASEVFAGL